MATGIARKLASGPIPQPHSLLPFASYSVSPCSYISTSPQSTFLGPNFKQIPLPETFSSAHLSSGRPQTFLGNFSALLMNLSKAIASGNLQLNAGSLNMALKKFPACHSSLSFAVIQALLLSSLPRLLTISSSLALSPK
jgi:hypothetical protein